MSFDTAVQQIAVAILPLIFSITLHEAAHGWVASKLGDTTALMLGRVSLNPIKHIDLLGTIILPIIMMLLGGVIFGWAKPVPVSWQNLKNPRRDMALVALAGPFANLLMAFFWALIAKIIITYFAGDDITNSAIKTAATFFYLASLFGIQINCLLIVLNLIPIPPLDGSRVISSILPPSLAMKYERIEPFGLWILLILLALGILGYILIPPTRFMIQEIKVLFGL